jgi:hypothetical protein
VRIFKTKWFAKFANQNWIEDTDLQEAIVRAEAGQIDADLGGGVIKQRIPRKNEGRSSGYRSIVLFKKDDRAFFAYGFAKNERENIRQDELGRFRALANDFLNYTVNDLQDAIDANLIFEVKNNEKDI